MSEKILRNSLFSAVTAAALGFGALQAFAAPTASKARLSCGDPWEEVRCIEYCQGLGADSGTCDVRYFNRCRCIYW